MFSEALLFFWYLAQKQNILEGGKKKKKKAVVSVETRGSNVWNLTGIKTWKSNVRPCSFPLQCFHPEKTLLKPSGVTKGP